MNAKTPPTTDALDLLEDAENPVSSAKDLNQAVRYADEMRDLDVRKEQLEEELKEVKVRYDKIQLELLPDLMLAIGINKFTLGSGEIIEVKDFVRGSIPTMGQIEKADEFDRGGLVDRRTAALKWLREVNAESLIKNQVLVEFGKGQDADAKALFEEISKKGFKVKCEEEVNFMTLNSYLKSELTKGKSIPVDPFALFVGKKADIKASKKGK